MKRSTSPLAFSLIELLLALASGMFIMLLLFATIRSTTATIKQATRMSVENRMMLTGITAAMDEVDFWTAVDDPFAASPDYAQGQGLRWWVPGTWHSTGLYNWHGDGQKRMCAGDRVGLPFTWLQEVREAKDVDGPVLIDLNIDPDAAVPPGRETDIGWNPNYHWSAADQRTWFHGTICDGRNTTHDDTGNALQQHADRKFGRYALFSNAAATAKLGTTGVPGLTFAPPGHFNAVDDTGSFGDAAPLHHWRDRQVLGLLFAIGEFGLLSYVPSNTVLLTYGAGFGPGRYLPEGIHPTWAWVGPGIGFGESISRAWNITPRSMYVHDNPGATNAWHGANDRIWFIENNDHQGGLGSFGLYRAGASSVQHMAKVVMRRPLNPQRPADAPELVVGVGRMYTAGRHLNLAQVKWTSPVTGEVQNLYFSLQGTNLRGARQQRRPQTLGGGWARWFAHGDARNEPNLDSYLKPAYTWNPAAPDSNADHYTRPK